RREMRERRILIPTSMNNGELATLVEPFKPGHSTAEAKVIINLADFVLRNAEIGTVLVIRIVAVGDERVQPVISTRQFQHHQDLSIRLRLRCKARGRLTEHRNRKRCSGTDTNAIHARPQKLPSAGLGKRKPALLHAYLLS